MAVRGDVRLDWAAFLGHVGALREVLVEAPPGRWALFTEDAYAFAVGLMAIWQAAGVAVVLPNGQPGTLSEVATGTLGLISDCASHPGGAPTIAALQPAAARPWRPAALDRTTPRLELFTSGTTGDRKAVVKAIAYLEDEVAGLERLWGADLHGRQALGTVSQQHIYGLLFRILWPLCAGRVFRGELLVHPEEMLARLGPEPRAYLVTMPAYLRRLPDMRGASALAEVCRPVFSSGAPLGAATAERLRDTFGFTPFEVFGSTETGGVAWRQQARDTAALAWTPFEGIEVSADASGLLQVASPYVSPPGCFTMADRVEILDDGRFIAHGRADRVVKVAGKRLALPEMEEELCRHPCVSEAALTLVAPTGEPRVAAVVVLSQHGWTRLREGGRRALSSELAAHLAPYWDRVLLPRLFRYVSRLPEDGQGKISSATLAGLFESRRDERPWAGAILDETATRTSCRRRLRVPDAQAFEGHFPELVVVPGFVQLDWLMGIADRLCGRPMTVTRIEALKFKELLRPGQVVELQAQLSEDAASVSFRLVRDDGRIVSSGRCWLAEEPP